MNIYILAIMMLMTWWGVSLFQRLDRLGVASIYLKGIGFVVGGLLLGMSVLSTFYLYGNANVNLIITMTLWLFCIGTLIWGGIMISVFLKIQKLRGAINWFSRNGSDMTLW